MRKNISLNRLTIILLTIWFIIAVFPFLWALLTSIKTPVDAFSIPPVWV